MPTEVDLSLFILQRRIERWLDERAAQEHARAARHLEHIHRSLGQRFRWARRELLASTR